MYKSILYVLVHMYEYVGCAVEHRVLYIFLACCNLAAPCYATLPTTSEFGQYGLSLLFFRAIMNTIFLF